MSEEHSIRLADGTLINTSTGKRTVATDINKAFSSDLNKESSNAKVSYSGGVRRYLDDLPVPVTQSRPIAIIAAYSIFGLSVPDIAFSLKVSNDQVQEVLDSPEYAAFVEGMLQNIREHDTNAVRKKLNRAAEHASDKMVDLIDSRSQAIAYQAAKDILDRAGHKVADKVEHRHSFDGITIRVIDDTQENKKPLNVEI